MTGRDPAIEAAQRACEGTGLKPRLPSATEVAAAREALASTRDRHSKAFSVQWPKDGMCDECQQVWPCETARLIYREDEL